MPCCAPPCPAPCCPPCCPPCCGYPVGGLGTLSCCPCSCCPPPCCGCGKPACCLGIASGASVNCTNQLPPSEVTVKPAPCSLVIPGPILTATCEPVRVGGCTACASCPPCGCACPKPC